MDKDAPVLTIATDDEMLRAALAEVAAAHGVAVVFAAPGTARALSLPTGSFRIGAVLDRAAAGPGVPASLSFGGFILSTADGTLLREGMAAQRLTEKERDILIALHAVNGAVVERGALLRAVWGYADAVETHTLETHIYRLRQKIEEDSAHPALLVTAENGYRLVI